MAIFQRFAFLLVAAVTAAPAIAWHDGDARKQVVRDVEAAINAQQLDRLDEYYSPDFVRYSQATYPAERIGLEEFKKVVAQYFVSFPDAQQETTMMVAEGDKVAFWGRFWGTHMAPIDGIPATGKLMTSDFAGIHRFENGKIVETWVTWDNLSMLRQLGLMPEPPSQSDNAEE